MGNHSGFHPNNEEIGPWKKNLGRFRVGHDTPSHYWVNEETGDIVAVIEHPIRSQKDKLAVIFPSEKVDSKVTRLRKKKKFRANYNDAEPIPKTDDERIAGSDSYVPKSALVRFMKRNVR